MSSDPFVGRIPNRRRPPQAHVDRMPTRAGAPSSPTRPLGGPSNNFPLSYANVPYIHHPLEGVVITSEAELAIPEDDYLGNLPQVTKGNFSQEANSGALSGRPPSFAELEFETIVRKLRNGARYKRANVEPKFPYLDHDWEFAGWGSLRYIDITAANLAEAERCIAQRKNRNQVGQLRATSVAGNAVFGSVFYSIPAIAAAAGILSPLCMVFSCLSFLLFKPIMSELGDAIRLNGANYMYLLNFSSKRLALLGAAVTLLDAIATGVTSAATAASYIQGEAPLPFPVSVLAILIILLFSAMLLVGIRESTGVTLSICLFHCVTTAGLVIAATVHWSRHGNSVIAVNWHTVPDTASSGARAIFNGICIGVLGVTGFESAPTYIEQIKPTAYDPTLRNLICGAFLFNLPALLLSFACLSVDEILSGANVLALLAERVAGKWLRYVVVADAVISLCGGVLTGGVAVSSLAEKLSHDRAIPFLFHRPLFASAAYLGICLALYAATTFDLAVVSNVFSISFMATMLLYTVSGFLLKFNRNALKRCSRAHLAVVLSAFITASVVILNLVINRPAVLYTFGAVLVCILAFLLTFQNVVGAAKWALYCLENLTWLRRRAKRWSKSLITVIRNLKSREICVWVKTDEISSMMDAVLYVRENEQTARLLMVHAYDSVGDIPSELEANTKLLDEAFPTITIDLVLVHGDFKPELLYAVSSKLNIPLSLHFLSGMRSSQLVDYGGARIIKM